MKLVVASFNPGKLHELKAIIARPEWTLVDLTAFPGAAAPDENGVTLVDNALIKARHAAAWTGLLAIADDTGLEVDALGGRPGVRSARYAGPAARAEDNVRLLLQELAGVPEPRRTARFRTVCAACAADGSTWTAEGVLEGAITTESRGTGGFGYDPVFEVAGLGRTLSEVEPAEKNSWSHRARAVRALIEQLPFAQA